MEALLPLQRVDGEVVTGLECVLDEGQYKFEELIIGGAPEDAERLMVRHERTHRLYHTCCMNACMPQWGQPCQALTLPSSLHTAHVPQAPPPFPPYLQTPSPVYSVTMTVAGCSRSTRSACPWLTMACIVASDHVRCVHPG